MTADHGASAMTPLLYGVLKVLDEQRGFGGGITAEGERMLTEAVRGPAAVRRHPAEVTAERLLEHVERWPDKWDGRERDALALVRHVLHEIADGDR